MKYSYALLGVGFIVIIGALFYVDSLKTQSATQPAKTMLTLASSAFAQNDTIPAKYTCDGDRTVSPPLTISGVPEGTKQLVLVMDDPDVPKALRPNGMFDHWVLYGIDPTTTTIPEGTTTGSAGVNSAGNAAYTGPCPPPEYQPTEHRYHFRVFAVDTMINFFAAPTKEQVLTAIQGHIIESAELVGKYERLKK